MKNTIRNSIKCFDEKKKSLENEVIQNLYLLGAKYLVVYVDCPSFNDGDPCIPRYYCAIDSIPLVLLENCYISCEQEEDEFWVENKYIIHETPYGKYALPTHKTPKDALEELDVSYSLMSLFDTLNKYDFPELEFSNADELLDLKAVKNCDFNTVTLLKFTETGLKSIDEVSFCG